MRRSRVQTRQLILDAAYGLFWRQGFLTGLDGRYRGARGHHQTRALSAFSEQGRSHHGGARAFQRACDRAAARVRTSDRPQCADRFVFWRACEVGVEAAMVRRGLHAGRRRAGRSARSSRARDRPARTRRWSRSGLPTRLAAARVRMPRARAREVMLLMEGTMALMLIHGDPGYATAAAQAAKKLVSTDKHSQRPRLTATCCRVHKARVLEICSIRNSQIGRTNPFQLTQ